MELHIVHLYADLMNIYGDRGNIIVLRRRAEWHGIRVTITNIGLGSRFDWQEADLIFVGGGQDRQQTLMAEDLQRTKADALHAALADNRVILAVCGGYQLLGKSYRGADKRTLPGVGLFDLVTEHPGPDARRCIGNILIRCTWDPDGRRLVGFENHGGRTYLGSECVPLGVVLSGHGNNDEDGGEGARVRQAFGTYLHGSLLPKNPWFADHLLELALRRKCGPHLTLAPLDNHMEVTAFEKMEHRLTKA